MTIYDELTRTIKEHDEQFQPKPIRQRGLLGYTVNSVYSVVEPTDSAQYRVRLDNKSFITAYHNGRCAPQPDLSVWVIQDELGRYFVESVDVTVVSSSNPNNPSQAFTAPHSHGRGSGMEFPIDPRLFSPFQIRPFSGLEVYVNGGAYQYEGKWNWFGGDTVNLTASVPATVGKQRWAILLLDHATASITVTNGALQGLASPLTLDQIESETLKGYPIGAIRLRYGQTGIAETDMEALHILVHGFPRHNYTATTAPDANDDANDGYGVSSQWYDQLTQIPYVCIDATVGAAVWVSGGGGAAVPISTTKNTVVIKEIFYSSILSSNGTFTIPITSTENNIEIVLYCRSTVSNFDTVYLTCNGDTTDANYRSNGFQSGTGLSNVASNSRVIGYSSGSDSETGGFSQILIHADSLRDVGLMRNFVGIANARRTSGQTNVVSTLGLTWRNTSAVTSIVLSPDDGSDFFSSGSFCIAYRIKELDVVTEVSGVQTELFPIELDYEETIPTNRQIVLSHVNIVSGGSLTVNGTVVFVGEE